MTYKQWANHLPNHIRGPYLRNLASEQQELTVTPDMDKDRIETEGLPGAIMFGFTWQNTPEGTDFWNKVYQTALARKAGIKQKYPLLSLLLMFFLMSLGLNAQDMPTISAPVMAIDDSTHMLTLATPTEADMYAYRTVQIGPKVWEKFIQTHIIEVDDWIEIAVKPDTDGLLEFSYLGVLWEVRRVIRPIRIYQTKNYDYDGNN